MALRILHVLDHSLPVQSGYSFRSAAIIREQRKLGWETTHVTSPKHGKASAAEEESDGLRFYRTAEPQGLLARAPIANQLAVIAALRERIREIVAIEKPDVIQAHSPCLNALAALNLGAPLVYELRSSWEDAAVSSGTTTEGSLRYRMSRWLETYALRKAHEVTTICEGLREDVIGRGVAPERITVIPNSVDAEGFAARPRATADMRGAIRAARQVRHRLHRVLLRVGRPGAADRGVAARTRRSAPTCGCCSWAAGPDERRCAPRSSAAACGNRVIFAGQMPHKDVGGLYDDALTCSHIRDCRCA